MDLSFIIVNYNTTALTLACIGSVYRFTKDNTFEVILIDNASADRSILEVKALYPDVIFLELSENVGFGGANNLGIAHANGKYLFLLNSDTLLTSDAASVFFKFMEEERHKQVGCCGAALVDGDGHDQISYGNFPSLKEAFSALGFLRLYPGYYRTKLSSGVKNHSEETRTVDYICGADMFLRKAVLETTGCFDPDFFLYFEEVELSLRIKKAGYLSVILPKVKIIHYESASLGTSVLNIQKAKYLARSRYLYFKKSRGMLSAMLINKVYALQALVFFIVKKKLSYLKIAGILFRA